MTQSQKHKRRDLRLRGERDREVKRERLSDEAVGALQCDCLDVVKLPSCSAFDSRFDGIVMVNKKTGKVLSPQDKNKSKQTKNMS